MLNEPNRNSYWHTACIGQELVLTDISGGLPLHLHGINCNLRQLFAVKICQVFLLNLGDLWGHIKVVKRISKTRLWLYLTLVTGEKNHKVT